MMEIVSVPVVCIPVCAHLITTATQAGANMTR